MRVIGVYDYAEQLLEFLGSDKLKEMIATTVGANDDMFKQGVMFGLVMSPYITLNMCKQYELEDSNDKTK